MSGTPRVYVVGDKDDTPNSISDWCQAKSPDGPVICTRDWSDGHTQHAAGNTSIIVAVWGDEHPKVGDAGPSERELYRLGILDGMLNIQPERSDKRYLVGFMRGVTLRKEMEGEV